MPESASATQTPAASSNVEGWPRWFKQTERGAVLRFDNETSYGVHIEHEEASWIGTQNGEWRYSEMSKEMFGWQQIAEPQPQQQAQEGEAPTSLVEMRMGMYFTDDAGARELLREGSRVLIDLRTEAHRLRTQLELAERGRATLDECVDEAAGACNAAGFPEGARLSKCIESLTADRDRLRKALEESVEVIRFYAEVDHSHPQDHDGDGNPYVSGPSDAERDCGNKASEYLAALARGEATNQVAPTPASS